MRYYMKIGVAILLIMMLVILSCVTDGRTIDEEDMGVFPMLLWLFQIIKKIYGKLYDWWLEQFGIPISDWFHTGEHCVDIKVG